MMIYYIIIVIIIYEYNWWRMIRIDIEWCGRAFWGIDCPNLNFNICGWETLPKSVKLVWCYGQQLLTSFRLDRSNKCMTCHERNLWLRSRSGDTCYLLKHFKTCWNHSLRFSAVVGLGAFSFSSQFFDHILDNLNVMMTIYDNLYLCLDWISTFGDLRCSFRRQLWPVTETSSQPEPQPPLKPGERKLSQETTRGRGHEWVGKWSTLKIYENI